MSKWPKGWVDGQKFICKTCKGEGEQDQPDQDECKFCDPWQGWKLCEKGGCVGAMWVPTKAQHARVKASMGMLKYYCPKCSGEAVEAWRIGPLT